VFLVPTKLCYDSSPTGMSSIPTSTTRSWLGQALTSPRNFENLGFPAFLGLLATSQQLVSASPLRVSPPPARSFSTLEGGSKRPQIRCFSGKVTIRFT